MRRPTPLVSPDEVAVVARYFREFGTITARRLPLYRRLTLATAEDPEVVGRLFLAPPAQRRPTLLLAAVHDVLLGGADDPLAAWYPSVTNPARAVGAGGNDPYPHFRRLALDDDRVAERLATRSTQTNEVGRCATLMPALAQLAEAAPGSPPEGGRPVGLVEVGASAGLNLLLDRYEYHYGAAGTVGGPSPVVISCQVRGDRPFPLPDAPPHLAWRVGLDVHPVDITDREQARWLIACQWPDEMDRLQRARAAVALARSDPPKVVRGDAVDDLAPLVADVPSFALPVVTATWVLAYLDEDRRRDLFAELDRLGADRDLSFLSLEHPDQVPGVAIPPPPDDVAEDRRFSVLSRFDWRDGRRTSYRLADLHPQGTWMRWLAP